MYCFLERSNDRVWKYHVKILSTLKMSVFVFLTSSSDKRKNGKLKGHPMIRKLIQDYNSNLVLVFYHGMAF